MKKEKMYTIRHRTKIVGGFYWGDACIELDLSLL